MNFASRANDAGFLRPPRRPIFHPLRLRRYATGVRAWNPTIRNGPLETRLVRVRGEVQGVGYREACVRRARELGVTG